MNYRQEKKKLKKLLHEQGMRVAYNPLNRCAGSEYEFYLFQLRMLKNMKRAKNGLKKAKKVAKTA